MDRFTYFDFFGFFYSFRDNGVGIGVGFYLLRQNDRSLFSFDFDTEFGVQFDILWIRILDHKFIIEK